jgi:hypothetical protein
MTDSTDDEVLDLNFEDYEPTPRDLSLASIMVESAQENGVGMDQCLRSLIVAAAGIYRSNYCEHVTCFLGLVGSLYLGVDRQFDKEREKRQRGRRTTTH